MNIRIRKTDYTDYDCWIVVTRDAETKGAGIIGIPYYTYEDALAAMRDWLNLYRKAKESLGNKNC